MAEETIEDLANRLAGLSMMAKQMGKFDATFLQEPIAGFIKSLCADMDSISDQLTDLAE